MLAVNQLNAQVKLLEMWKALNGNKYPLEIKQQSNSHDRAVTRADAINRPCEIGKSVLTQSTCISDAIRLWNGAPHSIKNCLTAYRAKKEIETYIKTLPV